MEENRKILIWYHKEDNDGVFSAAIIYNYLLDLMKIENTQIKLVGTCYADLSNQFKNDEALEQLTDHFTDVIMTDVSFNEISRMNKLYELYGNKFVWIDHHKPVIDASYINEFGKSPGYRDTNRSAILNAYHFFYDEFDLKYNDKTCPELLRILSAYDSWTYKQEGYRFNYVRHVNKGITNHFNLNIHEVIECVKRVLNSSNEQIAPFIRTMCRLGRTLNNYDDIRFENQIKLYGDFDWYVNNRPAVMIICQEGTSSTLFESVKKTHPKHKNGIVLKPWPNGSWTISLYNIYNETEFHCGEYLKKMFNGGGHIGAAGATLSQKKIIKLLTDKHF